MSTPMPTNIDTLAALPEGIVMRHLPDSVGRTPMETVYTADQMHAYARECIAAAPAAAPRIGLPEAAKASGNKWRKIADNPPVNEKCWFWVRPKTADEAYYDTSDKPILSGAKPHAVLCVYKGWMSLLTADHWMPTACYSPVPPPPPGC